MCAVLGSHPRPDPRPPLESYKKQGARLKRARGDGVRSIPTLINIIYRSRDEPASKVIRLGFQRILRVIRGSGSLQT